RHKEQQPVWLFIDIACLPIEIDWIATSFPFLAFLGRRVHGRRLHFSFAHDSKARLVARSSNKQFAVRRSAICSDYFCLVPSPTSSFLVPTTRLGSWHLQKCSLTTSQLCPATRPS